MQRDDDAIGLCDIPIECPVELGVFVLTLFHLNEGTTADPLTPSSTWTFTRTKRSLIGIVGARLRFAIAIRRVAAFRCDGNARRLPRPMQSVVTEEWATKQDCDQG